MSTCKGDQNKDKKKSKASCGSNQSTKFLEREGYNDFSLNFKGLAVSLNDFMPNQNESVRGATELDFDICKQMKKLEKKDAGTKQKALMELRDLLTTKDVDSVVGMLRYWPKVYNRLSVDEDKRVRELCQEIMSDLGRICGKSLSPYIKQLLPTWIFSQSDVHRTAAALATSSFESTFPSGDRRQKAYLLCWEEIAAMISTSVNRAPPKSAGIRKDVIQELELNAQEGSAECKDKKKVKAKKNLKEVTEECRGKKEVTEEYNEKKKGNETKKNLKEGTAECKDKKEMKKIEEKDSLEGNVNVSTSSLLNLDAYVHDIVSHIRTLVTLLPYINNDPQATQDVVTWLHSKSFWAHYNVNSPINVLVIYLTLSKDLLTHVPHLIIDVPFIISHITVALRLVDNYHSTIICLVWSTIMQSILVLGDTIWTHVSFLSTFLPKWLRMLECGTDGHVTLSSSFQLPFFTKMPIDIAKGDSIHIYTRIFEAMLTSVTCARVRYNREECNAAIATILECATYTILSARAACNEPLKERVLTSVVWHILEQYLTDPDHSKADKTVSLFCHTTLRPLINKEVISTSHVITTLITLIDRHHDNALFSHHLSLLITELSHVQVHDSLFSVSVMPPIQKRLLDLVVDKQCCLLPYLSVISSHTVTGHEQLADAFIQCNNMITMYTDTTTTAIIASAMANIINHLPDQAQQLYNSFLATLTSEQLHLIFYDHFYGPFIAHINDHVIAVVVASTTLSNWLQTLSNQLESVLSTEIDVNVQKTLSLIFGHCHQSSLHRAHVTDIIALLTSFMSRVTTESMVTTDTIDTMITVAKFTIEEMQSHFTLDVIPCAMVLGLIKMVLSTASANYSNVDMSSVQLYLHNISTPNMHHILVSIIDEVLLSDSRHYDAICQLVSITLSVSLDHQNIESHIYQMLIKDITMIDHQLANQQRYSLSLVDQHSLVLLLHKLNVLLRVTSGHYTSLLATAVDHCCMLLTPILLTTYSSCNLATNLLQQCESVYTHTSTFMALHQTDMIDLMLISTQSNDVPILAHCSSLVLVALKHFIPTNYSQWSHSIRASVDLAIHTWTESDLSPSQSLLTFSVLIPSALRARYLVQEIILASISSLLSAESNPNLCDINRALLLVKSLTTADSSFFTVCYPLIMSVRSKFQAHIDELYHATVDTTNDHFDLSSLLEFLIVGIESTTLDRTQWDFVLCLISSLSRSSQFIDTGDFTVNSVSDNTDHIINSFLLLRLIANVAIAIASVTIDSVLDEWDNFFSEPIFTTILDMFSLISGDHTHGKLVSSDLFLFYTEALAEVVSLCPVAVLLAHQFTSQIHINDPIELPKDFLLVFNSLLESLSSYSLSTQLAAYNCLLNLTDHLSGLLLDQITKAESNESLESFSINLPHKLLFYLQSDELTQLTVDKLENEIVLTRCFLAWSVLLQLFSCSQAKVRAEISTFLVMHNRCFDNFLNFCFAFMPKSPLVNKKHLSFLAVHGRQSSNLISDEPNIFSKCLDTRSKFVIYHLSSYIFRRSVQVLPNLARSWFMSLDVPSQQHVETYMRQYLTPELFKIEFAQLKDAVGTEFDDRLDIQTLPVIGQVTVVYIVPGDQCLEQVITLPNNYPIGKVAVDFKKEMKVKIPHWKSWIIQMTSTMQNQNGSILDGVKLWKKNLDNHFDGVEECMICYSILHAIKYTLPSMKCRQCKKKFHKDCMYKWFQSSTNPTCPNCRNVFYDGTYRKAQYGDIDMQ